MDDKKFFGLIFAAGFTIVAGFLIFLLGPGQWAQLIGLVVMAAPVLGTPVLVMSAGDK